MLEQAALLPDATADSRHPALRVVPGERLDTEAPAPPPPLARRLEVAPYDLPAALALEQDLGISHVLAQTLVRRGFLHAPAARAFLDAREEHPASAFDGIDRAVEVVERHIRAGSRIVIHGDYDVDGVCATASMVRALRALGADVGWFLPARIDDGYGLSMENVERIAARGARLLITVDCAITAVEAVRAAQELGLDVVVTDHHQPRADGLLPDCPIVHPGVCGYPCTELCGTGVAYKLAQAMGVSEADEYVELVALATVADLMPLRGENRRLVQQGLAALARTASPGLRALMTVARVDPSALDARAVGFRLAPRINAAGRLRRADAGVELLLTDDERRAAQIAAELDDANSERRAVERHIAWEVDAQLAEFGERSAYVLAAEGWHPGVIGIVASRVVESRHRPAVLVALEDGGVGRGSGRSIPGFDLLGALHACAAHLDRYGGHRAAAGLTIRAERLEDFRDAFELHAQGVLTPELLQPVHPVDAVVSGSDLGLRLAEELEQLEPCGMGNPRPRLLVPGARFGNLRPMGEAGRHARFTVVAGGTTTPAVAFGCDGRLEPRPGEPADAIFYLERNFWQGTVAPRLVLGCTWPCAPPPIDVLGEPSDYLRAALDELERPLASQAAQPAAESGAAAPRDPPGPRTTPPGPRTTLDRRGESPLAVLADALAAGGPVLAVCADVSRRLPGLCARIGGFALTSYHALEREVDLADRHRHLVALDPPAGQLQSALLERGSGYTHLAWGDAELRFAQQMHELEYGLRASLVALYRGLRSRERVAGQELERLLRGDGPHGRPARLAGRMIRVLAELELVSLDPDLPALSIAGRAPTALDRSPAYRVYAKRYEDGQRFLNNSANRPPSSLLAAAALAR